MGNNYKITMRKTIHNQDEIDGRLLAVIRYVLAIPEKRLKPKKEQATKGKAKTQEATA
jgi:hypothetical protein